MRPVTQRQPLEANKWIAGLITEASPLNFPEGASLDEENFVIDRDGSRARRRGLDYEAGYTTVSLEQSSTASGRAIQNFLWENVNENPQSNFLVHQFGNRLYVFNSDTTAVSSNMLFGGAVSLTATVNTRFSFASIQGDLVVAVGDQTLRTIRYESSASASIAYTRITVRDFWGVDDGFATDERTVSLTNLHAYNLYNQGWPPEFFCSTEGTANPTEMNNGTTTDPVEATKTYLGIYPSNADVIYTAMTFFTNGRKAYFPFALENIVSGNTPAASGHYIIDLFNRSQGRIDTYQADIDAGWTARVNYTASIPTDQSTGGIKAIAAYAGRLFYACSPGETGGDNRSPHIGTFVLFSQLVDNRVDIGKCYQEADPTAEEISDLIDTDGGYIQLPDVINIKALIPFGSQLLVFADNGVWAIAGGDRGFTATEYQSLLLTNNGAISAESIVVTESAVFYWSRNGIYVIGAETSTQVITAGRLQPQSVTEETIQGLYNAIPYNSKKYATGYYDEVESKIRWLYQNSHDSDFPQKYTHELILDVSIPAWSKFTFQDITARTPRVSGYCPVPIQSRGFANANFKYSTLAPDLSGTYVMTTSYYKNTDFVDWYTADVSATSTVSRGADAAAYLVTGYMTGGDSARHKYLPYLTVHCRRVLEDTSATASSSSTTTASSSVMAAWAGNLAYAQEFRLPGSASTFPSELGTAMENIFGVLTGTGACEPYMVVPRTLSADHRLYVAGDGKHKWARSGVNQCPPIFTFEMLCAPQQAYQNSVGLHGGYMGFSGASTNHSTNFGWIQSNEASARGAYYTSVNGAAAGAGESISYSYAASSTLPYNLSGFEHIAIERCGHRWSLFKNGTRVNYIEKSESASLSIFGAISIFYTYWNTIEATASQSLITGVSGVGSFKGMVDSFRITCDETVYGNVSSFTPPTRLLDKWRMLYHFEETLSAQTAVNNTMWGKAWYDGDENYLKISASGSAAISNLQYKFGTSSLRCTGGYFTTQARYHTMIGKSRFTIDFWIRPETTLSANSYIFDSRGTQQAGDTAREALAIHGTDSGRIAFKWGDNASMLSSTDAIAVQTWTHIAVERNSLNAVSAYVGGNLIGSSTVTASIDYANTNLFTIGGSNLGASGLGAYLGYIDEFRFMLHTAAYSQASFTPQTSAYSNRGLPGKV